MTSSWDFHNFQFHTGFFFKCETGSFQLLPLGVFPTSCFLYQVFPLPGVLSTMYILYQVFLLRVFSLTGVFSTRCLLYQVFLYQVFLLPTFSLPGVFSTRCFLNQVFSKSGFSLPGNFPTRFFLYKVFSLPVFFSGIFSNLRYFSNFCYFSSFLICITFPHMRYFSSRSGNVFRRYFLFMYCYEMFLQM